MDLPNIKDSLQKLKFLADYSTLLLPIIITLAAITILVLTPVLIGSKLEEKIQKQSVSTGKKVKSLISTAVSSKQDDVEQEYQQDYSEDANRISSKAMQSSLRPLLSYKIFPEPKESSSLIFEEFAKKYRVGLEEKLLSINASDCPSAEELEQHSQGASSVASRERTGKRAARTSGDVSDAIKDVLCEERARSTFVYGDPTVFSGYEPWENYSYTGVAEDTQLCWYWQLGYWIIEDVIDSAGSANAGTKNVFTSAVKRILDVSFASADKSGADRGFSSIDGSDMPGYVLSSEQGLMSPYNKRFTSGDIDVVHFKVSVIVSSKAVLSFMKELCSIKNHEFMGFDGKAEPKKYTRNQITILASQIEPVDTADAMHTLYRYGKEDAVVKLDLICEYIFNKKGYSPIKPAAIKAAIGDGDGQSSPGQRGRRGRGRK